MTAIVHKLTPPVEPITVDSGVLLRLGERCNMACPMCTNSKRPELEMMSTAEALRRVAQVCDLGFRRIVLTGGEPAIHPGFRDIVAACAARRVTWDLITNGTPFHRGDLARRCRDAGLERALVSLHSHDPEVSAQITGVSVRHHARTVAGARALLAAGVDVRLNCVLSTLNVDSLADYVAFCARELGSRVRLLFTFPSLELFGRRWEPLHLSLSGVRDAVRAIPQTAARHGIADVRFQSIPNCVLGDEAAVGFSRATWGETHYLDDPTGTHLYSIRHIQSVAFVYAPHCRQCAALDRCPGVGRKYAARYGVAELEPFPSAFPPS